MQADPSALTMIFRNLIDNAIKYSSDSPTRISFRGRPTGSAYHLDVIHENSKFLADARSLGRLFYRGTNSQGAGVGLYLIQSLVEKMKGKAKFSPDNHRFSAHLELLRTPEEVNHGL